MRVLLVLVLLAGGLGGAAYMMREDVINWWLQRQLAGELSRRLGAHVELERVRYRDGVLSTGLCRVQGERLPFSSLEIKDARLPIGLERLKNPAGEPLHLEAASVDLVWRDVPPPEAGLPRKDKDAIGDGGAMPVVEMVVGAFTFRHLDDTRWRVTDSAVRATFDAGEWKFSGRGGRVNAPGWPELRLENISGQHAAGETRIAEFAVSEAQGGSVSGSASGADGDWSGDFRWKNVAMDLLLPAGAKKHFVGRSNGEARLAGGVLTGRMELEGSEVRNLPALVKLASIFTGEDYRTVAWETARFNFIRDARGAVLVEDLNAESSKGLSLRGSAAFAKDHLSADLQLGLKREGRPWLVAFMPVLFRKEQDGYLWTPVTVGGTPQSPTEDLSSRVVAALAVAPAMQAVETAVEVPAAAVEAAGGLLRGLLGR